MEMGIREPRRHLFLAAQKEIATLVLVEVAVVAGRSRSVGKRRGVLPA